MHDLLQPLRRGMARGLFACSALLGAALLPASAGAAKPIAVTLAVGGKSSVNYLPLTLAERLGYFKDEGLDVKITDFASGSKALQSLVGGSADVVMGYYDHTIQMHAKNQDIRAFVQTGRYPGLVMGVTKGFADKYRGLQDLKGARVGVIGPGSSTHFMLNYLLQKEGVALDAPSIVAVGVGPMVVAAVKQQKVDVVVNVEPVTTMMERDGDIKVVADTRTEAGTRAVYDGIYPAAVLYARNGLLEKQPEVAQKLASAMVRTLHWIAAATPQQIVDAMPSDYYLGDKALYLAVIEKSIHLYSPDGLMRQEDAETAYRVLKKFDNSVAKSGDFDLHQTYTNDFVTRATASLAAAKP
ncbi:ABC transporter substrate-binding protein [Bordetella bronchiseptica]|uniref:ABC transporter substrate-binding protein n=1 Tax=Bordetella bronchiseptica TaxID=518 RepID=UPI0004A1020A|nr:ABC transporter substrate-binding protein [Bordetella bronchiseptica]AWQ04106.1 ABC transporter substrate-binding protein [Bordetella bronchiseptica]KDD57956.1 NMT1/THI5-like protein [Bordetella bronchiseptica OSU553]